MRPADIANDDIIQAGLAIEAEGKRVSGYALRKAFGNRGDAPRMHAIWEGFVASRQVSATGPALPIPAEVEDHLAAMAEVMDGQWRELVGKLLLLAKAATDRELAEHDKLAEEKSAGLLADLAEANAEVARLDAELTAVREQAEASQALYDSLQTALGTERERSAQLQERCEHYEQANAALEGKLFALAEKLTAADASAQDLRLELNTVRMALQAQGEQLSQANSARAALAEQLQQAQAQHAVELAALRGEHQAALAAGKGLTERLLQDLEDQKVAHQEDRKRASQEAQRSAERYQQAEREAAEAREQARDAEKALAKCEGIVETLREQVTRLSPAKPAKAGAAGS